MSFSRWKLMAGVLTVSLGGLATVAGQCPKKDDTKGSKNPAEVSADSPAIPPIPMVKTASGPALPPPPPDIVKIPDPMPMIPSPQVAPVPPGAGVVPPAMVGGSVNSDMGLSGTVQVGQLPALPAPQPIGPPSVQMPPMSSKASGAPQVIVPAGATAVPQLMPPAPDTTIPPTPQAPESKLTPPIVPTSDLKAPTQVVLPVTSGPPAAPVLISGPPGSPVQAVTPPSTPGNNGTTGTRTPPAPDEPPSFTPTAPARGESTFTPTPPKADPLVSNTAKFRILVRVGEGEPTFEVRSGDDLVLKVMCEKVDIKSPEKGPGPSSVKASGKVHFAGFGAEGTCDELSFLAGTGEVSMTGSVKIQVKDKLGRIESELSTETVKYKIGGSATAYGTGTLRP